MGNQISVEAHSTYAPTTIESKKTGYSDPRDGSLTIAVVTPPWFVIPVIVEKILSYVEGGEPVDI